MRRSGTVMSLWKAVRLASSTGTIIGSAGAAWFGPNVVLIAAAARTGMIHHGEGARKRRVASLATNTAAHR